MLSKSPLGECKGAPEAFFGRQITTAKERSLTETAELAPDVSAGSQRRVARWRPALAWRRWTHSRHSTASTYASRESPTPRDGAGDGPQPLPIAAALMSALDAAGVRYGVIQDVSTLPQALAGRDDIDLLVDKRDHAVFCSTICKLRGIRGTSLSCYDNVCAGREDWFLPDFAHGRYLHLDVHVGVRVGWEFRKRYPIVDLISPWQWERVAIGNVSVPVAAPEAELRRAITRYAFGFWAPPWRRWVVLRGDWEGLLARQPLLLGEDGQHVVEFVADRGRNMSCRIRRDNDNMLIHRGDLRKLRRSIRDECGFAGLGIADFAVHLARKASYAALRLLQRIMPGSIPPKRRPENGGLVIALVGPDGVGKSTQVDRLAQVFRWKFGCVKAYAGTGDGRGWWLRKLLGKRLVPRGQRIKATIQSKGEALRSRKWTSNVFAAGLACWGLLIAFERHAMVKRAHRSATRGLIVVCDRWPQALQPGYLDGPIIPSDPDRHPVIAAFARLEQKLYRKMQRMRPHLTLHLVSDHSVSERRKPGGIKKEAFDARLSLMAELRRLDNDIKTVDASASMEAVGRDLFRHVWLSL